jgi:uncharacterized protein (TIGR03437 family)
VGLKSVKLFPAALLLFGLSGSLAAAPKLRLATTTFGPYSIAVGSNDVPQAIEAYNAGDGTLALTATSSVAWLNPSIGPSQVCRSVPQPACLPVRIAFQTAALAAGTYTGEITVNDPNALDAPQIITVTVKIGGGIPDNLDLYVAPNGSSASATVSTSSYTSFSTATLDGRSWLAVAASGFGSFGFGVTYVVSGTHLSGMSEGTYSGSLGFFGSAFAPDNKTVQVHLHVTSQPIAGVPQQLQFRAVQNSASQTSTLNVNNRGLGSLAVSSVTATGGAWLSAGSPGTAIAITANPAGLAPGVYTGSVAVASNAVNGTVTVPVQLTVVAQGAPFTYFGGAVNIATYRATDSVGQGDIVSVWGEQLSDQPHSATAVPLSTQLGPTRVLVNGQPAPLYYASAGQVNIQVPFETAAGEAVVRVERDGQLGNAVSMQVVGRSPHILPIPSTDYAIIWNWSQNNSFPMPITPGYPSHPAHIGDVFVIWIIGLGQGNPPVATGAGAPGAEPLARIPTTLKVHFGDRFSNTAIDAAPLDVVMTPTLVGLYQVSVLVPQGAQKGNRVPFYLDLGNGSLSNQVLIAVE